MTVARSMTRVEATGIDYDSSLRAVADPAAAGKFFRLHRPRSRAAWCAEFARLAYCDDRATIESSLARVGFRLVAVFAHDGTEGLLAEGAAFSILVFRGSDDVRAWITNLDVRPVSWRGGGRVHSGFAAALDTTWPVVQAALRETRAPLLFSGHSLGAALATLAASLVPDAVLITFGSPRVGDSAFRANMVRRPGEMCRYVNNRDIVCRVPSARLGYRHVGTPHLIDTDGRVSRRAPRHQGLATLLADSLNWDGIRTATRIGRNLPRELTDHAPINYVSALR